MPKHVRGDVGMIVARQAVILQQQTDRLIGDRPPVAVAKKEILCLCMTVCHAMIRLQRPARTGASDGQQPLLLSFSADAQRVREQVDITDAQLTELGDAHTRGEQQFKERNIAKGAHLAKRGICQVCLSVEITEKVLQSCRRDRSGKRQRFLKVRADLIERIFFDPLMEDEIGEKSMQAGELSPDASGGIARVQPAEIIFQKGAGRRPSVQKVAKLPQITAIGLDGLSIQTSALFALGQI